MLSRAKLFQVFRQKIERTVIVLSFGQSCSTPYLGVRDGKLPNAVRLVEFRPRKVAGHTFGGWSQAGMLRRPSHRNYRKPYNFSVLAFILEKFHIRTRLIDSFPTIFRTWCGEEKLHFTPVHTLRRLKRDEALIPPLRRVAAFRVRYG